jgi:hypothetical protein
MTDGFIKQLECRQYRWIKALNEPTGEDGLLGFASGDDFTSFFECPT